MADDTAPGQKSFDLNATDGLVSGREVIIAETSLRWSGGECPFEDIVAIKLLCDTSDELEATCLILRANGTRLTIKLTGKPRSEPAIYRDFVRSFVEKLGPAHRARIAFRPLDQGSPALIWGALLVADGGIFVWGVLTNQIAAAPENRYILPVTGLLMPLFAWLFWKSLHRREPRPIDPEKLDAFLPPIYYDRS